MTEAARPLKIIQLSDCHVAADPDADYRGHNADRNLASVLQAVIEWRPDLVLLTGDVSEDASEASYRRVSRKLAALGAPVLALPGNHDDPAVMRRFFPAGPWQGPHVTRMQRWRLVLLDSTEPGRISGVLDQRSLAWLESEARSNPDCHRLVALHHQPLEVGAPWIDQYRLDSPEPFLAWAEQDSALRCVIWGHVHHAFRCATHGVEWLGAPSTAANSLPGTERFTLDEAGPACRWLKLHPDGRLESGVLPAGC
jgi:Icc protein